MKIPTILVFLASLISLAAPFGAALAAAPTWQSSTAPVYQLGIRDKYGELGGYDATFVVRAPDGKSYRKKIHVNGDEFGYVSFPDDFQTWAAPGRYRWSGIVNGKSVISDGFTISSPDTN